jgi:hypothetical protein
MPSQVYLGGNIKASTFFLMLCSYFASTTFLQKIFFLVTHVRACVGARLLQVVVGLDVRCWSYLCR